MSDSTSRGSVASFIGSNVGKALLVLSACALFRAGPELTPELEANPISQLTDADSDGLPDAFERYLAQSTTDPVLLASDIDPDSDGDGQPDGFEYCLSGGRSIVTPSTIWPVEPRITLGSHQEGDQLVLTVYVIPGSISDIQGFHFVAAVPGENGAAPTIVDLTELFVVSVEQVAVTAYGSHTMAIYQVRLPVSLIRANSGIAIAALGTVAGVETGHSATFTAKANIAYRWEYDTYQQGGTTHGQGVAQPQVTGVPDGATAQLVCGTVDVHEPTGTPGVLESIVVSIGCTGGTWSCPGGVCSTTGGGAKKKVILDVGALFD